MKLSKAKQKEIATKRQYRFEEEAHILYPWRKQITFQEASEFACMHWRGIRCLSVKKLPLVWFSKGLKQGSRYLSYADLNDPPRIVLAVGQRDKITLLHELLHHEGLEHGKKFYGRMVHYLSTAYAFDRKELIAEGLKFGLEYK